MKTIEFNNAGITMVGNLFYPPGFNDAHKYPAIVCIHPGGGVKEQTAGVYAEQLAKEGFVTLAFDASLGQTLIVTSGVGWTQCEGGPKTEIRSGDVIWCPCQRRHWHGATATTAMSHIAITEVLDGVPVSWMEPVTDEQYLAAPVAGQMEVK